MKLLSRQEEMLLIAVWRLQHEAYGVKIRELLKELTGKEWAFGAIFTMLDRLVQKELLSSYLTDPTPERGGRSKRIYQLRKDGKQALIEIQQVQKTLWEGMEKLGFENK
ncbi:MAG: BlaI/MecI/CopY family transcriptional regulator [Bacteroidetes bacterium]|nr:BlaI/MecI/CopY family transcriptional regulator [Bacteroidota bacterium]